MVDVAGKLVIILRRRRDVVIEESARTNFDHGSACLVHTLIKF